MDLYTQIKILIEIGESLNYFRISPKEKNKQIRRIAIILEDYEKFKLENERYYESVDLDMTVVNSMQIELEISILMFFKRYSFFNPKTKTLLTTKAVNIAASNSPLTTFCKLDLTPKIIGDKKFYSVLNELINIDEKYIKKYQYLEDIANQFKYGGKSFLDDDLKITQDWKDYEKLQAEYESEFDLVKTIASKTDLDEPEIRNILSYEYILQIDKSILKDVIISVENEISGFRKLLENTHIEILEEHLEQIIRRNFNAFFPELKLIDNQQQHRTIKGNYIDIFALHPEKTYVVIELKKGKSPQKALAQLLDYMNQISQEYQTEKVRGILVSRNIDNRTRSAFNYLINNLKDKNSISIKEFRFDIEIE